MDKVHVFLATPISGCADGAEYHDLRTRIIELIGRLRVEGFEVFSEIEEILDENSYDSPGDSVKKDFENIQKSYAFVMYHPRRMQSSTLIELGFAYAQEKKIIIVGSLSDLPYLVHGFQEVRSNVHIIDSAILDDATIAEIIKRIK